MTQELARQEDRPQELEQARFMPVMSIGVAVNRRNTIVEAVQKLMKDGQDYGAIPGTTKPTLLQPGADKLNNLFGLVPRFFINEKEEDWTGERHGGEPMFAYTVTCQLHRGDYLMGEGYGSCNSWESKYRYRKSERTCPSCGQASIVKGKSEYGGGWLCFAKKGGCGAKFKDNDPSITEQIVGKVTNPEIFDQVNTILKMANKRAKIAATLNATSAHEFFTQDMEDIQPQQEHHDAPPVRSEPQRNPPPQVQEAPEVPEQVQKMYDHMKSIATICEVLSALKKRMSELMGMAGDAEYYRLLKKYAGVSHANEVKSKAKARETVYVMWQSIQLAESLGVSQDDAPQGPEDAA